VDTPFGKIAVFVCYELRFPEIARRMALEGAQIILVPAAWYQGPSKKEQFQMLARTRALENTVFLLACNQCGGGTTGGSLAADPMGRIMAEAGEGEQLLTIHVDTGQISEARRRLPCLEQRHPELYGCVFGDRAEN
jgi:predicted amidohydrolase